MLRSFLGFFLGFFLRGFSCCCMVKVVEVVLGGFWLGCKPESPSRKLGKPKLGSPASAAVGRLRKPKACGLHSTATRCQRVGRAKRFVYELNVV